MSKLAKIIGFISQKIGFSCSSRNSRDFIEGWFLGTGTTVKAWRFESRPFGKIEFKFGFAVHTRKDFKFGFFKVRYDFRIGFVFAFGYGAFVLSYYRQAPTSQEGSTT